MRQRAIAQVVVVGASLLASAGWTRQTAAPSPQQVLERLRQGNQRFLQGAPYPGDLVADRKATAKEQRPIAAVLSCIDSRAPAERIFDTRLGEIFNARVAGNIADPDIVASLEYATKVAGARVLVVLGHTDCGAVKSACKGVKLGHITGLLEKIKPAEKLVTEPPDPSCGPRFVDEMAEQNVLLTIRHLREMSPILRDLEQKGDLVIQGAMYDLSTGEVSFLSPVHPGPRSGRR